MITENKFLLMRKHHEMSVAISKAEDTLMQVMEPLCPDYTFNPLIPDNVMMWIESAVYYALGEEKAGQYFLWLYEYHIRNEPMHVEDGVVIESFSDWWMYHMPEDV